MLHWIITDTFTCIFIWRVIKLLYKLNLKYVLYKWEKYWILHQTDHADWKPKGLSLRKQTDIKTKIISVCAPLEPLYFPQNMISSIKKWSRLQRLGHHRRFWYSYCICTEAPNKRPSWYDNHVRIQGGGGGRAGGLVPPLKNKNIGSLKNTGPGPQKNHKATKPAFNVGL